MKRIIVCAVSVFLVLCLFAACGNKQEPETPTKSDSVPAPAADSLAATTIGEALALAEEGTQVSATYDNAYVCVVEANGAYWRLTAELTAEQHDALAGLDIFDENYEEKENELISPLEITKYENLNKQLLSEEDMAALAGKTGADLLNDGWTTGMGYDLDSMEFYWEYGPFEYTVTFEKNETLENSDDFDVEAAVAGLKVVSVAFSSLGNSCTDLPE